MVIDNVEIIINSAASVNFDEPLKEGVKTNYFGCMRMLDLSKECKKLKIFTHISTAYVNCNRKGYCKEEIYNPDDDVESIVKNILNTDVKELSDNLKTYIG